MNKNNDVGGMGIFSKKHEMIRELMKELMENETAPMAAQIDKTREYPGEPCRKIVNCGFYATVIPKKYRGCGGDTVSATIVTEEFTKVDASVSARLMSDSSSGESLMMFGNETQEQKYLRGMAEGKLIDTFAITKPGAGSDTVAITTMTEMDGDYHILNRRKCFIINDPCHDSVTVFTKTDANTRGVKRTSAFIVESAWEGLSRDAVESKIGMHGSPACDLVFESVCVPKKNLLTSKGRGFKICMVTLDSGRIIVATQDLGIAQSAPDEAVKCVKERVQFGKPISKLQNTQFETADMATKVECGRQLAYHAAKLKGAGKPCSRNAIMAKYRHGDLYSNIMYRSLQLRGGYGYMKDYPIGRIFRDARLVAIYESTLEIQRMVTANHALGK